MNRVEARGHEQAIIEAGRHLEEHGWAVIPDVVSAEESTSIQSKVWACLEKVSRGRVSRADATTWQGAKFFKAMKGILMEPSPIYHCEGMWDARVAMAPYFAHLYGDAELATSMDRLNIYPAPNGADIKEKQVGAWLHTDQTPLRNGRCCIQGFLDLEGTGPLDGGLMVADKSHLKHHELLFREWKIQESGNWILFTDEQRATIEANFTILKVQCPPRSLVLWESRVFHYNQPPVIGGHARFVIYVCMQPWAHSKKSDEAKAKKIIAYSSMRGTSHWPLDSKLFSMYARSYGEPLADYDMSPDTIMQPLLYENKTIARLVGFENGPVIEWGANGRPLPALHMDAPQLLGLAKPALLKLLGVAPTSKKRKGPRQDADTPQPVKKKGRITISLV